MDLETKLKAVLEMERRAGDAIAKAKEFGLDAFEEGVAAIESLKNTQSKAKKLARLLKVKKF